jgi:hypothetical protein
MKKLLIASAAFLFAFQLNAQNTVCFTIQANPNQTDPALANFTKYVNVNYWFNIYAEPTISDAKVLHAAAVAAELLDNDEDGIADDQALITELVSHDALIPIFSQENSQAEQDFFNFYNGNGVAAVLYNDEVDPSHTGHWGDDASVEEILHTINAVGHANVYPAAFSPAANSSLMSAAMDTARGGQFLSIPNPYPAAAWYHYDDVTCDYECMAIEYIYWSIVSNMGILDDAQTCAGIANEWEPCSPALFQATDVLMYNLITDPQYKLPQLAPNGNYCPATVGINDQTLDVGFEVFPNPATTQIYVKFLVESPADATIQITNSLGQTVTSIALKSNTQLVQINTGQWSSGIYIVRLGQHSKKIVLR